MNAGNMLPWIIMEDFNSILNVEDSIGGYPMNMVEISDFHVCIEGCALLELPKKGKIYTWNDKRDTRVFTNLDWVLINPKWLMKMPAFTANCYQKE